MSIWALGSNDRDVRKAALMQREIEFEKRKNPEISESDIVKRIFPEEIEFWEKHVRGKDRIYFEW